MPPAEPLLVAADPVQSRNNSSLLDPESQPRTGINSSEADISVTSANFDVNSETNPSEENRA